MNQAAFADTAEFYRVDAALKLDPGRRSDLGQYMTPAPIARFMASLFVDVSGDIRLLDPGAGVGSLTAAFVEWICAAAEKPRSVSLAAYEIEPVLRAYLRNTVDEAVAQCRRAPNEASRILCIATVTGFTPNDPHYHSSWFSPERGVEKWYDPNAKTLSAAPDAQHTNLAVQIGFAARFDLDELEAETIRFFVYDEATLGDPFAEDAHLRTIHTKILQELGFFLVPASRTWDRWISFLSELFCRVVATRGDMPAQAVRAERARLWACP